MDRSLRWKTIALTALTVLSLGSLLPSTNLALPGWYASLFDKQVQLGLDLEGGLHIVYGVALNKVVEDKAIQIKQDIEQRLAELKIAGKVETPREPLGAAFLVVEQAADLAKVKDIFAEYEKDGVVVTVASCGHDPKLSLCRRVSTDFADGIKESALAQAIKTIKDRVDRYGIAEATVIKKGDAIIVELPGLDEVRIERLKGVINRTAELEFKMVVDGKDDKPGYMQKLLSKVQDDERAAELGITGQTDVWDHEDGGQFSSVYLTASDREESVTPEEAETHGCLSGEKTSDGKIRCKLTGRVRMQTWLVEVGGGDETLEVPDDWEMRYQELDPNEVGKDLTAAAGRTWRSYLLERAAGLKGTEISSAEVTWNPTTNRPEVLVTFDRRGGRQFDKLTGDHIGDKMAIVLDGRVTSAPVIQGRISGGRSTITMGTSDPAETQRASQDLVNVLRTGALPAPLEKESESQVGALLGDDAIASAKLSMALGALFVILIMLYFYKFSGVIANFAMVLNVLFQLAILVVLDATLTLPGIAGVVLTIGMAVDSNIIIYERIREELRAGKSVRGAVDAGFSRAFWTVFDAHVTNFVAGFVLLEYGTGPIRGFAVMLLIGVVCNLFTSTWASRLMFDHYLARRAPTTPLSI